MTKFHVPESCVADLGLDSDYSESDSARSTPKSRGKKDDARNRPDRPLKITLSLKPYQRRLIRDYYSYDCPLDADGKAGANKESGKKAGKRAIKNTSKKANKKSSAKAHHLDDWPERLCIWASTSTFMEFASILIGLTMTSSRLLAAAYNLQPMGAFLLLPLVVVFLLCEYGDLEESRRQVGKSMSIQADISDGISRVVCVTFTGSLFFGGLMLNKF